jgi:hypothetical protein
MSSVGITERDLGQMLDIAGSYGEHATGPVPLFEVDDVHQARQVLEAAGARVIGAPGQDRDWDWIHFLAPDGNLYEMASRRRS